MKVSIMADSGGAQKFLQIDLFHIVIFSYSWYDSHVNSNIFIIPKKKKSEPYLWKAKQYQTKNNIYMKHCLCGLHCDSKWPEKLPSIMELWMNRLSADHVMKD